MDRRAAGGAAFTAGYVVLVLTNALRRPVAPVELKKRVSRLSEFAALALAVSSLLLAFAAMGPLPGSLISNPLLPKELVPTLLVFLGGTLLALGLSRRSLFGDGDSDGTVRRGTVAVGRGFELADSFLRRWPTASLALLLSAVVFGGLMLARGSQ